MFAEGFAMSTIEQAEALVAKMTRGEKAQQGRRLGASEAELLRTYPGLRAEDLANAWAYVRAHREEIDTQIRDNEAA